MATRHHVVITGTGRSGTTFIVELLTHLGLETGFTANDVAAVLNGDARAGLEHDIRQSPCPYIVKSPWFCDYAEQILASAEIVIDHIFVPFRDVNAAAESRRYVTRTSEVRLDMAERLKHWIKPRRFPGGLWHTNSTKPGVQEEILLNQLHKLMLAVSNSTVPVTLMRYPRITSDCAYLFGKLEPLLAEITYESFCGAFQKTVRPDLVHRFTGDDCERRAA